MSKHLPPPPSGKGTKPTNQPFIKQPTDIQQTSHFLTLTGSGSYSELPES